MTCHDIRNSDNIVCCIYPYFKYRELLTRSIDGNMVICFVCAIWKFNNCLIDSNQPYVRYFNLQCFYRLNYVRHWAPHRVSQHNWEDPCHTWGDDGCIWQFGHHGSHPYLPRQLSFSRESEGTEGESCKFQQNSIYLLKTWFTLDTWPKPSITLRIHLC